jgi:hypothetical protein
MTVIIITMATTTITGMDPAGIGVTTIMTHPATTHGVASIGVDHITGVGVIMAGITTIKNYLHKDKAWI